MTGRLNPHFMLLQKLCETVQEANRILMRESARPHVARAAQATISAIEPIAITLLDEEYASVPRVRDAAYSSGSLALAKKITALSGARAVLIAETWRILLVNTSAAHVEALLENLVRPDNLALPLLERLHDGEEEYTALLARVSSLDAQANLQATSFHHLFALSHCPGHAAIFLRHQVAAFPEKYRQVASDAVAAGNWNSAVQLFLAGAAMPKPDPRSQSAMTTFLSMIDSNHGKLAAIATLGTLEATLEKSARLDALHRLCNDRAFA